MSRRQALPCRAQRSHGRGPCGNYAIVGGTVCADHVGMAPQVRAAADRRAQQARIQAMLAPSIAAHRALLASRAELAARILGCPPEEAAAPYAALLAAWRLDHDPQAGGLSAAERDLLHPRRPEEF